MSEEYPTIEDEIEKDIRPCPRCGSKAILAGTYNDQIICNGCGMWTGEDMEDLGEAIKWWNEQPLNDQLRARIAEADEVMAEVLNLTRNFFRAKVAELEAQLAHQYDRIDRFVALVDKLEQALAAATAWMPVEDGELLPCPFCGTVPQVDCFDDISTNDDGDHGWVYCGNRRCFAVGPAIGLTSDESKDVQAAIAAWNRRATPASTDEVPS